MTTTVNTVMIERPAVFGNCSAYHVSEVLIPNIANAAAGGAGQTVTLPIVFSQQNLPASLNYTIQAVANQACAVSYTSKATTGFSLVLTPLTSGITLASGTVDCIVSWGNG